MEKRDVIVGLSALAQDTRLDIFRLLVQAGSEGRAVGRIGETLNLPSATLSFHLSQLKHADLVTVRREGRSLIYTANFAAMNGLLGYLTENCCAGDGTDCAVGAAVCDPSGNTRIKEGTDA
jgi:DNA-binding transcriptional ArsR family regulator